MNQGWWTSRVASWSCAKGWCENPFSHLRSRKSLPAYAGFAAVLVVAWTSFSFAQETSGSPPPHRRITDGKPLGDTRPTARLAASPDRTGRTDPKRPSAGARTSDAGRAPQTPFLRTVARQAALDRAGFSPGLIDGQVGPKTKLALRTFQEVCGLSATAEFDAAADAALRINDQPVLVRYTVAETDLRMVGEVPSDWNAKADLSRLNYESLAALLAERGHCTRAALARLNPGRDLNRLRAGDTVSLPIVTPDAAKAGIASVEVDLSAKVVRSRDAGGRTVALFHCSTPRLATQRPRGATRIASVTRDPDYTFDPAKWPEVRGVTRKLTIPPGPRNPVGVCWIGLELDGHGIHGTPAPEMIGKTGSHGCIRLTNWDALRLAHLVRVGTPVRFVGS